MRALPYEFYPFLQADVMIVPPRVAEPEISSIDSNAVKSHELPKGWQLGHAVATRENVYWLNSGSDLIISQIICTA